MLNKYLVLLLNSLCLEISLLYVEINKAKDIKPPSANVKSRIKTIHGIKNIVYCFFSHLIFVFFVLTFPDVVKCVLQEYLVYPIDHCLYTLFPCVGVIIPKVQDVS